MTGGGVDVPWACCSTQLTGQPGRVAGCGGGRLSPVRSGAKCLLSSHRPLAGAAPTPGGPNDLSGVRRRGEASLAGRPQYCSLGSGAASLSPQAAPDSRLGWLAFSLSTRASFTLVSVWLSAG